MEEKLRTIFLEDIQAKRVRREIETHNQSEEMKRNTEVKYSFLKGEQLTITLLLKPRLFSKLPVDKRPTEDIFCRISYTRNYPYDKPRVFFLSDNLNSHSTIACRDYVNELCNHSWSTKYQLADLINFMPHLYLKLLEAKPINSLGIYNRGDFIEFEALYNQKHLEVYPITIQVSDKPESAFLVINRVDILFLEVTPFDSYARLVQVYPIASIRSIYNSKKVPKQMLIQVKWGSLEGAFEFKSQDRDNIVSSVLQKKRLYEEDYKNIEEKFQLKSVAPPPPPETQQSPTKSPVNYLEELNESIVVLESLLDKQYDDSKLNSLIILYKKGVEYCSANNISNYKFYLNKLQELLARDETQVLINSQSEDREHSGRVNHSIFEHYDDKK